MVASFGDSVLHQAATKGDLKLVRLLIKHGADLDLKDNFGKTAIHKANESRHINIVKLLADSGAIGAESFL